MKSGVFMLVSKPVRRVLGLSAAIGLLFGFEGNRALAQNLSTVTVAPTSVVGGSATTATMGFRRILLLIGWLGQSMTQGMRFVAGCRKTRNSILAERAEMIRHWLLTPMSLESTR